MNTIWKKHWNLDICISYNINNNYNTNNVNNNNNMDDLTRVVIEIYETSYETSLWRVS